MPENCARILRTPKISFGAFFVFEISQGINSGASIPLVLNIVDFCSELPHSVIARPCLRQGRGDLIEKFFMRLLRCARNDMGGCFAALAMT